MKPKIRVAVCLAFLLSLFAIPVFAGGWAIISLDEVPAGVVAGEPLTVGFTVLQHGQTPMNDLQPTVTASLYKKSEFVVDAEPDGKPGHYIATFTFPVEGEWDWSIQAFTLEQKMPVLSVAAPGIVNLEGQSSGTSEPVVESASLLNIIRISSLGVGLVGLLVAFHRKSRLAMAVTVVSLLVGAGTFVAGPAVPDVEAQSNAPVKTMSEASIPQAEIGRQLFIAKGCITCHVNEKAAQASEHMTFLTDAPDLTKFSASPEALRMRLEDPASVKSDTWMPDLNLSDSEIDALIAFINSN